jgi:hypothetical protein
MKQVHIPVSDGEKAEIDLAAQGEGLPRAAWARIVLLRAARKLVSQDER